jgi:hypothetical protein
MSLSARADVTTAWRVVDDGAMRIELLVVPDCPNAEPATRALHVALTELGIGDVAIRTVVVNTDEQAQVWGFAGSPTFRVDGRDIFGSDQTPALSCRLYPGAGGVPNQKDLTDALRRALP